MLKLFWVGFCGSHTIQNSLSTQTIHKLTYLKAQSHYATKFRETYLSQFSVMPSMNLIDFCLHDMWFLRYTQFTRYLSRYPALQSTEKKGRQLSKFPYFFPFFLKILYYHNLYVLGVHFYNLIMNIGVLWSSAMPA